MSRRLNSLERLQVRWLRLLPHGFIPHGVKILDGLKVQILDGMNVKVLVGTTVQVLLGMMPAILCMTVQVILGMMPAILCMTVQVLLGTKVPVLLGMKVPFRTGGFLRALLGGDTMRRIANCGMRETNSWSGRKRLS